LGHPDSSSDLIKWGKQQYEKSTKIRCTVNEIEKSLGLNPESDPMPYLMRLPRTHIGSWTLFCHWNLFCHPAAAPADQRKATIDTAQQQEAEVHLDEQATRRIIDAQIRDANGTRPVKGHNVAIAEWPTANGPADYVLFVGLLPVATLAPNGVSDVL
jgi:hypothetical protein